MNFVCSFACDVTMLKLLHRSNHFDTFLHEGCLRAKAENDNCFR